MREVVLTLKAIISPKQNETNIEIVINKENDYSIENHSKSDDEVIDINESLILSNSQYQHVQNRLPILNMRIDMNKSLVISNSQNQNSVQNYLSK